MFFDPTHLPVTRENGTSTACRAHDLHQFPWDYVSTVPGSGKTSGPQLRLITRGGSIAESTSRVADNISGSVGQG